MCSWLVSFFLSTSSASVICYLLRISILLLLFSTRAIGQESSPKPDVIDYQLRLEPDFEEASLNGVVNISFTLDSEMSQVVFDKGNMDIIEVNGSYVSGYHIEENKIFIQLADRTELNLQVQVRYKSKPSKGLMFDREAKQIYTVYHTNEWMVCNMDVSDRASISMDILLPEDLTGIANGKLIKESKPENGEKWVSWSQEHSTSAYTYGFVVGSFEKFSSEYNGVALNYYSAKHSPETLQVIFEKTSDILSFLEEKSGSSYIENSYSQILIGDHYQEMSGLSVLRSSYGELVLNDTTETNLITHELAHQWWGNMITCKTLNHFWLNEGFATYLSAAYNEYRFGEEKYLSDIDSYYQVYKRIKDKGADKPLVFEDWSNPTRDDRNLVYFKGAYVLHILRQELGEEVFWNGIRLYSQRFFGHSVTTQDFQQVMEESAGKSLQAFFDKWVYSS